MAALDPETGLLDRRASIAARVTPPTHARPEEDIQDVLQASEAESGGPHMLVETQLSARSDHPEQLRHGLAEVGDGTEHQRGNAGVERGAGHGKPFRDTVYHLDRDGGILGAPSGKSAEVGFRLDRHELRH